MLIDGGRLSEELRLLGENIDFRKLREWFVVGNAGSGNLLRRWNGH